MLYFCVIKKLTKQNFLGYFEYRIFLMRVLWVWDILKRRIFWWETFDFYRRIHFKVMLLFTESAKINSTWRFHRQVFMEVLSYPLPLKSLVVRHTMNRLWCFSYNQGFQYLFLTHTSRLTSRTNVKDPHWRYNGRNRSLPTAPSWSAIPTIERFHYITF